MDDETAGADDGDEPAADVESPDEQGESRDADPEEVPDGATENHWKQLVLEMEQSAEEHRKAGWRTAVLHPTASGVIDDEEPGVGVVVRREEFDGLDEIVSVHEIDEYEVLRADLPGEIQFLTILYSADAEVAIFVPAAVDEDRLEGLRAVVDGTFYTHVTPPEDDATVSFTHDDPSLFFPGAEMPRTARTREGTPGTSDRSAVEGTETDADEES
ncbi:DUF7529 family protein [Haloglomus halophilum]|uniref:DUF7529 family protein n=1 Tax=Haloglomus halophilum TaxID=2962672 RepID=UPI0020C9B521|nr:hypothetical protein [Haloglomus halophilum]